MRDLWQHKDVGTFGTSGYTATVEAHDVVVIRVFESTIISTVVQLFDAIEVSTVKHKSDIK